MDDTVGRDTAVKIAKDEAARQGHPWIEPTHVEENADAYVVHSNAD